jgi:hypothetical protein
MNRAGALILSTDRLHPVSNPVLSCEIWALDRTRGAEVAGVVLIVAMGLGLYQRAASARGVYVGLQSNTIAEIDRTACETQGARQVCTSNGIPGDKGLHNMSVQAPSPTAAFFRWLRANIPNGP